MLIKFPGYCEKSSNEYAHFSVVGCRLLWAYAQEWLGGSYNSFVFIYLLFFEKPIH